MGFIIPIGEDEAEQLGRQIAWRQYLHQQQLTAWGLSFEIGNAMIRLGIPGESPEGVRFEKLARDAYLKRVGLLWP